MPTGFPNLVSLQIPVQTGSRNEVEPGKSGFAHFFEHMMFRGTQAYPPEQYQADHDQGRRARRTPTPTDDYTQLPHHLREGGPRDDPRASRPTASRTSRTPRRPSRPRRARCSASTTRTAPNPLQKLFEVQREHAFTTHTYKHTTMGFIKDIEDMPNQYEYSKTFFDRWYRPEYTTVIVAGDVDARRGAAARREVLGRLEARDATRVDDPAGAAADGPARTRTCPGRAPTLPWVTRRVPRPGVLRDRARTSPALDMLVDLDLRPDLGPLQALVEHEQKVDQLFAVRPGERRPVAVHRAAPA